MYIYYVLRGMRGDQPVEFEGDIEEADFSSINLHDGPAISAHLSKNIHQDEWVEWTECDLTDDFFNREDNYIYFNGRWMRRSDAPWRKDRNN